MQSIYVSQIATLVWTHDPLTAGKPVVVGLAIKRLPDVSHGAEAPRKAFLGCMKLVMDCLKQRDGPLPGLASVA